MSANYLLGLVGHPVARSLSPPMHRAALEFCHLQGSYELFDVAPENFADQIAQLKELGLSGFNVTVPHKTRILSHCARLSATVERVGAANTIKIDEDGALFADNTDIAGFASALSSEFGSVSGNTVCLLGAGGAAKAALAVLLERGAAKIFILARDKVKAETLCHDWQEKNHSDTEIMPVSFGDSATIGGAELFINTIPFGLTAELDRDFFSQVFINSGAADCKIFDMAYSRDGSDTKLVGLAKELNLRVCDGTSMLVHQALKAFEIWTDQVVPFDIMNDALMVTRSAHSNQSNVKN